MTNLKILAAMGTMAVLAAVVARVTLSRTKIFSPPPKTLIKTETTEFPSPTIIPTGAKEPVLILADWRYPGAEIVSLDGSRLSLKSTDSVEAITSWYKKKITDLDLNIRNFVQTTTNGTVSNHLTGRGEKEKVQIEIDKESSSLSVKIVVTVNEQSN